MRRDVLAALVLQIVLIGRVTEIRTPKQAGAGSEKEAVIHVTKGDQTGENIPVRLGANSPKLRVGQVRSFTVRQESNGYVLESFERVKR